MNITKIIRWLVYLGAFLIPLWFLPFTSDVLEFNKQVLLLIVAGAGLVLYLVDMIKSGVLRFRASPWYWSIAGFLVAGIVSVAVSTNRYASLFGDANSRSFSLLTWLSIAVIFFLSVSVMEDRGKSLRSILVSSLGLTFVVGLLQVIGVHIFPILNTVGSLNMLGLLAGACLPILLTRTEAEIRWQKISIEVLRFAGLAAAILILIIVNWSSVWIVTFVSILAYVAFTSAINTQQSKMKLFALPMAVIIIGSFLWIINFNWTNIKSKLPLEVAPKHVTSYRIAIDSLKDRPLGFGLENFAVGYEKFKTADSVNNVLFQATFTDATSEIATMAVEGGILMLVAFLLFIVFMIRALLRNIRQRFSDDPNQSKLWATCVALVVLFFLYPVGITPLVVLFLLLAVSTLNDATEGERVYNLEGKGIYSVAGSAVFIVGLVAVLIGTYFVANQFIANVKYAQAQKEKDSEAKVGLLVDSINGYPKDARAYRTLTQVLLEQIADDVKNGPRGRSQADFSNQLQNRVKSVLSVANRLTDIDPSDSENWLTRGYVYQNLIPIIPGADEFAINMYKEVLSRSPMNALAYVRIGNVHLGLADNAAKGTSRQTITEHLNSAEENFQNAIDLYNNYGQALYNLAAVYDRKGELTQAIKQFGRLQQTNPRDPSILFQLGLLLYRNNQHDQAQKAWEQAVLLFPDYSNARWYLSLVYEEQNDFKRALDEVKVIQKLNPDNQLVKDRLDKLEAGLRTFTPPATVLNQTPLNNEH